MKTVDITVNIEETIYQELMQRYKKSVLTKQELANELSISVGSINNYICSGKKLPHYLKLGGAKNGRVVFPLRTIASFISNELILVA